MKLTQRYRPNLSLLTDLYQLTMSNGYFKAGMHELSSVFHLFYRKQPFNGNFTIAAGLSDVIDLLQNFHFDEEDIEFLADQRNAKGEALFDQKFLNYLADLRFKGNLYAIPEGSVVFPFHPILRIETDLITAQLLETAMLNIINFQSLIATKSARICLAAEGDKVMEFGLRRAQGPDGGLSAARAAYIGGCHATSNVLAGRLYGIPISGTHAHSWVMSFENELDAFMSYASSQPDDSVLLVDTYDTLAGVKKAIVVAQHLAANGSRLKGIRLDSGDLCQLSIEARALLDEAGCTDVKIVASNDLDEYRIKALKEQGAKIDIWGVGTRLVTAYDQAALGGVYKLAALEDPKSGQMLDKVKLSEQNIKTSLPGKLNSMRLYAKSSLPVTDIIYNENEGFSSRYFNLYSNSISDIVYHKKETQLQAIFKQGKLVYQSPGLDAIRAFAMKQSRLFKDAPQHVNGITEKLHLKREKIINNLRNQNTK